jgi:hypothetical protein
MQLNEIVKSFFKEEKVELPSEPTNDKVLNHLDDNSYNIGSFFDDSEKQFYAESEKASLIDKQNEKIDQYRKIAGTPNVSDAIEEIINEVTFDVNDDTFLLDIDEENDKIKDVINEEFEYILDLLNTNRNLYHIVKQSYIDGQLIFHCGYSKNTKEGIQEIKLIEPKNFLFDKKTETFKYYEKSQYGGGLKAKDDLEFSKEEIVRENFGLYDGNIILSYLEYAIKPANQLKTLEDLLIPMRFSRSISRRVFNVDVGELPNTRVQEVMTAYQNKFKYKKFYNPETGEVSNQQHVTSMVEDYWFANRNGGKGTQVDTLDESGNLGELDDILYFNKKLYKALFIPANRINLMEDSDFDYNDSRVTKDDMKFFMFVNRVRKVYTSALKEILRRQLISKGIMKDTEWKDFKKKISLKFNSENGFIEKMNLENFSEKIDLYATMQEYQGKLFGVRETLQKVFKYDDEKIDEVLKEIETESNDPKYKNFYKSEEDGGAW